MTETVTVETMRRVKHTVVAVVDGLRRRLWQLATPRSRPDVVEARRVLQTMIDQLEVGPRREQEILRLANVLRRLERVLAAPKRTPQEMARAVWQARRILAATGKPVEGHCDRCGYVALQRARRCPRCDLTEPDGVKRGTHSKRILRNLRHGLRRHATDDDGEPPAPEGGDGGVHPTRDGAHRGGGRGDVHDHGGLPGPALVRPPVAVGHFGSARAPVGAAGDRGATSRVVVGARLTRQQAFGVEPDGVMSMSPGRTTWYFAKCPRLPSYDGCGCVRSRCEGDPLFGWEWEIRACPAHGVEAFR